jgi:hypothetical protein
MPNTELLQVLPLAIFEYGNVPEQYRVPAPKDQPVVRTSPRLLPISPIRFSVDRRCFTSTEVTVVPALGRVSNKGIRLTHTDESTAAVMGSIHGWIGHVEVASKGLEMARIVRVTQIVPYCVDPSEKHNDAVENLLKHIHQGRGAGTRIEPDSHKHPLDSGVVYRRNGRLLPHCDNPPGDGLEVVYNFGFGRVHGSAPRLVFSR